MANAKHEWDCKKIKKKKAKEVLARISKTQTLII